MKQSVAKDELVVCTAELANKEVGQNDDDHRLRQHVFRPQPHGDKGRHQMIESKRQKRGNKETQRTELPEHLMYPSAVSFGNEISHSRPGTAQKVVNKLVQLGEQQHVVTIAIRN